MTENIKAQGLANITIINANATSYATKVLNKGAGQVAKQNIEYTTMGLKYVQDKLSFTDPKTSLLEYFYLQRLQALSDNTQNKLLVGINGTFIQN